MLKRRRFLTIAASCAALDGVFAASAPGADSASNTSVWKGVAMGALASITIVHQDRGHARALIESCVQEIERLEAIFSLYRPDSALSRLNAAGELADPPTELVELLSFSLGLARLTGGAFDPTVQPLFELYLAHFARPGAPASGPSAQFIEQTLQRVGFGAVEVGADRIRLRRPGAAITLNGVAQGFVTDRVADLMKRGGLENVLVNLGEGRAAGRRADGEHWHASVTDPAAPGRPLFELTLGSEAGMLSALATSGGYGTRFGADPLVHHLLDPVIGRSVNHFASVSVAAPRATLADGLSTALAILPPARTQALLAAYPRARAWLVDAAGHVTTAGAIAVRTDANGAHPAAVA
ncbi:MAG: FAD:protein FMN transferase [Burkholderiales bacterium]